MIRSLLLSIALVSAAVPAFAMNSATSDYVDVLKRHLSPGPDGILLFDYAAVHEGDDHAVIEAFIEDQAARAPSEMDEAEALAYWANLYNAVTLDVVLNNYPLNSIRQFGLFNTGPWDKELVTVEGEALSLNNIEHGIMRAEYPSPYIHYMVNCASIGCPNLMDRLWEAETLEVDQKAAAAAYINSDRGLTLSNGTISISKIYKWYAADFGSKDDLRTHLATYATGERLDALTGGDRFRGSHYSWDLNRK